MSIKEKLRVVRFALPAAVIGFLGNVVGVEYARSKGWISDGGPLDVVAHANNFFDSLIVTSAASLAIDVAKSPRNLPLRKAVAVGGMVMGVGLGMNMVSETSLAHEPQFSAIFAEDTTGDVYDFAYGAAGSLAVAAACTIAVRETEKRDPNLE